MSHVLYRWGRAAARHPWRMVGAWLVVVLAVVTLRSAVGGDPSDNFTIPGTEAQRGIDLLDQRFPAQGGVSGQIVFADPDGDITDPAAHAAVEATLARLAEGPNVLGVTDPYDAANRAVSPDRRIAYTTVRYKIDPPGKAEGKAAEAAVETARQAGLRAEISRTIVRAAEPVEGKEAIGLIVAVVVLLVAFGSVIAAGIPIATALFGIFIGLGLIGVMAGLTDVPSISPLLATMIGLGVGIDYALFIVTRHRGFLHEGRSVEDAAGLANATSGSAVLFAGTTVVIAIAGLRIAGIPAIATMGLASAITVAVAMVAAVTLLPALLGLAGTRIDKLHIGRRRSLETVDARRTIAGRWADHVGRHPWRYAIASFVGLVALAAPVLVMRTGVADDGTASRDATYRKAYDLLAEGFGRGVNGPLTIVVDGSGGVNATARVRDAVASTSGVVFVSQPIVNPAGDTAVLTAIPATSPQDKATETLVHHLRDVLPQALRGTGSSSYVTGQTAIYIDISERLASRLPLFIIAVVGLSVLLLMVVFRSVLVPLKAAVMNLLSIGAAYGVVVAVF
ncbi:MAG TPA: MMPL family transporter, partial [Acidimicrobiales bacterium]